MDQDGSDCDPRRGDEYAHPSGTTEIVFTVRDGRVLTFREYTSIEQFSEAVAEAAYRGVNDDVAELPPAEAFEVEPSETDDN
jgi:hypothetical protein